MQVRRIVHVAAAVALLSVTAPASAHHAGTIQYDSNKPMTLTGTVTRIDWQYPHAGFSLDVKDASGTITTWEFVLEGPGNLLRRGWTKTSLKPGDVVSVRAYPARDGSPQASAVDVTFSDGRRLK